MKLNTSLKENERTLDKIFDIKNNFDIVNRSIILSNRDVNLYFVDGFVKDEIMEKIMEFLYGSTFDFTKPIDIIEKSFIPYVEVSISDQINDITTFVLSGMLAMIIDGYDYAIMIDSRTYPVRSIEEPDTDKVLRGSRDGFVETMIFNCALIRRKIRDTNLRMKLLQVGNASKTDIVISYLDNKVDKKLLNRLIDQIEHMDIQSITMGQESLAEVLIKQKWYNPFPCVKFSERPDSVTANILEGRIIIIIDNTPAVLILPTYLLDFAQEAQDYYFPTLLGSYIRMIRILVFFMSFVITPIWLLMIQNPNLVPEFLKFMLVDKPTNIPIFLQLIMLELGLDALQLASLNTPSTLNSSLSIIGGLILGEFAIKAGWFNSEAILYMAFVAMSSFTYTSFELSYAIKFSRILLLILIASFNIYGFIIGILIVLYMLFTSKSYSFKNYLYPLFPLDLKQLKKFIVREKL